MGHSKLNGYFQQVAWKGKSPMRPFAFRCVFYHMRTACLHAYNLLTCVFLIDRYSPRSSSSSDRTAPSPTSISSPSQVVSITHSVTKATGPFELIIFLYRECETLILKNRQIMFF